METEASIQPKPRRKLLYWLILLVLLALLAELAGYAGMKWKSRQMDFMGSGTYFHIRDMLMDNPDPKTFPKYLSQPYLGYIPFPGFTKYDSVQHNADGYRGKQVPLMKDGKYRILCLGGSTTYGFGVKYPSQTFPARLDSLLNSDPEIIAKHKGVEVINAGVEAANSAEELAYYVHKFRYYQPDLVLINSGGNDALMGFDDKNYQPDYTNFRRMDFNLKPLPKRSRWIMKSYLLSFIAINLFYERSQAPTFYFSQDGSARYCHWNTLNNDSLIKANNYSYYAFYHNFNSIINEIRSDSSDVMVLPFVLNPNDNLVKTSPYYQSNVTRNNSIMSSIATAKGGKDILFTYDSIASKNSWLDDCHLDQAGELQKAQVIARAVKERLQNHSHFSTLAH